MPKKIARFLLIVLVILIAIQFIRPEKNQSASLTTNDISEVYSVPQDVQAILSKACNDCHSNNTIYPWYNTIQPVAWWLNNHIKNGKRHLNFSDFGGYRIARQYKKLKDCEEELKEGDMPLNSYTWIHKNAILSTQEKQKLTDWCELVRTTIRSNYPADSLIAPSYK
jgi:hypothetical protein